MTDKPASQEMSEWLKIMLLEIDRKNDEQSRAESEHRRRNGETVALPLVPPSKIAPESRG
jgi:hypothetical protein